MREIKFRAWDEESKEFITPDEAGFSLDKNGSLTGWWWTEDKSWQLKLQQFTGLKDKNGREIYEGDIVKGNYVIKIGYQEEVFKGFISIGDGEEDNEYISMCGVYFDEYNKGNYYLYPNYDEDYKNIEIIGNIYENFELLK